LIWLRYAREIASSDGLFSLVEAAAGRRVALVQAAIWTVSYLLYLVYTTVDVVYDMLPSPEHNCSHGQQIASQQQTNIMPLLLGAACGSGGRTRPASTKGPAPPPLA
jgi:hypothetical protein